MARFKNQYGLTVLWLAMTDIVLRSSRKCDDSLFPCENRDIVQRLISVFLALPLLCLGTSIPRISLEDAVNRSEMIVTGDVIRTWAAWDSQHRFIWTHTEIAVRDRWKGTTGRTITVSEPGGFAEGSGQAIAGMVRYAPGEQVVAFLYRTPHGYIRTMGLAQGKFVIDVQGLVHVATTEAQIVPSAASSGSPMKELEAMSVSAMRDRIIRIASNAKAVRK
jgi:hypothetical protein